MCTNGGKLLTLQLRLIMHEASARLQSTPDVPQLDHSGMKYNKWYATYSDLQESLLCGIVCGQISELNQASAVQ